MKGMRRFLWIPWVVMLCVAGCAGEGAGGHDDSPLDLASFQADMSRVLAGAPIRDRLAGAELDRAKFAVDDQYGPEQWRQLLELRLAEEDDLLRRLWWSKDDRTTRVFIMALFWGERPPPDPAAPWPKGIQTFDADSLRFADAERTLRLEEVRFVRRHLPIICRQLAAALREVRDPVAQRLAARYAQVAAGR